MLEGQRQTLQRGGALSRRIGTGLLGVFVVLGLGAPWIAPYDPVTQPDPVAGRHLPPLSRRVAVELDHGGWLLADRVERTATELQIERLGRRESLPLERIRNLEGDGVRDVHFFLLGTDRFSRDVLSRLLYGARISLLIGSLAVVLALTLGVMAGALAALGGPLVDGLIMRLVDGLLAFPWMFLILALAALVDGGGTGPLILLLGGTSWMSIARLTRAEILSLQKRDFVEAARALGAGPIDILWHHLLPNAMTPLMVFGTLAIGRLILTEAAISFLGFGVPAPLASWGNMIADGRDSMLSAWWVSTFPAVALVTTVIAINLLSDGLRDLLDPRLRESAHAVPSPAR